MYPRIFRLMLVVVIIKNNDKIMVSFCAGTGGRSLDVVQSGVRAGG